jgi:enoyl-CoA hydratase/carnithine racemase
MSAEQRVTISIDGGVADVRMNRPDKMNALDGAQFAAIVEAGESLKTTPGVRAVVLSGEGRAFCAGLDFGSFQQMAGGGGGGGGERPPREERPASDGIADLNGRITHTGQQAAWVWQELDVPVIAAVHGVALGGGAQIALGADIRISARELKLCVMEIKYGLIPDMGISQVLPMLVPLDVAKEIVFTGRTLGAGEALDLGLVTRVADDPLAEAKALAAEIASKSPHAIRSGKRLLNECYTGRSEAALKLEAELQRALIGSPNQIAAVTAAMTKEPAEFKDA